jgi:hypothetical protein
MGGGMKGGEMQKKIHLGRKSIFLASQNKKGERESLFFFWLIRVESHQLRQLFSGKEEEEEE